VKFFFLFKGQCGRSVGDKSRAKPRQAALSWQLGSFLATRCFARGSKRDLAPGWSSASPATLESLFAVQMRRAAVLQTLDSGQRITTDVLVSGTVTLGLQTLVYLYPSYYMN
jgi:hypothetical protein